MVRRTTRASRKLSKNLKRNTFKKKRMKRNISKNKRTKGGFWGRCHKRWEKLITGAPTYMKDNYPRIINVHGDLRASRYDIKIPFRESYITINNMRISDMKKLHKKLKSEITNNDSNFENFTFTNVIRGSEENCKQRFRKVNDFFNYIKDFINSHDSPAIKEALEKYDAVYPDVQTGVSSEEETWIQKIDGIINALDRWYDRVEYSRLRKPAMKRSVIIAKLQSKFPKSPSLSETNLRGKKIKDIVELFKDLYMGLVLSHEEARELGQDYVDKRYELEYWFERFIVL